MADPGVPGDRVVRHAEHEHHEGDGERRQRTAQRDDRRHRHEPERGHHHQTLLAAVEVVADREGGQTGELADPDHGRQLRRTDPEGPLERGQERSDPPECGVGDRFGGGDRGERRLLDAQRVHLHARRAACSFRAGFSVGHGIVTSTPKNVQVVSEIVVPSAAVGVLPAVVVPSVVVGDVVAFAMSAVTFA